MKKAKFVVDVKASLVGPIKNRPLINRICWVDSNKIGSSLNSLDLSHVFHLFGIYMPLLKLVFSPTLFYTRNRLMDSTKATFEPRI